MKRRHLLKIADKCIKMSNNFEDAGLHTISEDLLKISSKIAIEACKKVNQPIKLFEYYIIT